MNAKRRPGRPPAEQRRVPRLDVLVTPELRRRVRIAAAAADMTLGAWVAEACEEKLSPSGSARPHQTISS